MKLCLNPLSRVNSILIQACHIACRHIYQCLNPLSRVNSILIVIDSSTTVSDIVNCLNPLSRVNSILMVLLAKKGAIK